MSNKINTINMLILDPSSNDAEQTINILRNSGHAVRSLQIKNEDDLEAALAKQTWDLFIVKDKLDNPSAEQCLKIVKHYGYDISFIMTTSQYSVERTLEAMRIGMKDVVPEDNDEYFKLVVERELASIQNKRQRDSSDKALLETDKRNELLLDSSRDAVAYITDGMHIYANHAYMELFGYEDTEELECLPIMDLIDPEQHEEFKKYLKNHLKGENNGDNEEFFFTGLNAAEQNFDASLSLTDSTYDDEKCIQVYIKKAAHNDEELERKLHELTINDTLTGLYNQQYIIERLNDSINQSSSNKPFSALLYIDLDKFDDIREEHGISESNHYLKDAAHWLKDKNTTDTIVARVSDSTFAILLEIDEASKAESFSQNLCKQFSSHLFEVSQHTVTDTLSIGICIIDDSSLEAEKVLSNAHFASSRVQTQGGNGVRLHDNSLDSLNTRDDVQIAMELQDAMDENRIHVMYEPIVKLHGKLQQIFHARLMVDSKEGQRQFIDDAYQIGLHTATAFQLDQWLMTEAFKTFSEYLGERPKCKLKIHLTAASLLSDHLVKNLCDLVSQNNLPVSSVIFEFSEMDCVAYQKQTVSIFKDMSEHKLTTAISNFGGTDNSQSIIASISSEHFLWVSLEPALLKDFTSNSDAQTKVKDLLTIAHEKNLISIAPGISDAGSLATIWPMNVHHIHGEYIGFSSDKMAFDFSESAF